MNCFKNRQSFYIRLLIVIVASILFIPFAGGVHLFDWDEINFAECAREMIVSKDYLNVQINFQPFWEKPPLFIWMQVLGMKVFGINEFSARLPNAICGIISLLIIFNIGKKLFNTRFGLWWVFVYTGSILPHFYFRSGIIDPWFNLFMFVALWFFFKLNATEKISDWMKFTNAMFWGVFTGLAILTKGPTALIIVGLVAAITYLNDFFRLIGLASLNIRYLPTYRLKFSSVFIFLLFSVLIGGSWFLIQIVYGHSDMVWKFILYQVRLFTIPDAGHGGHWSYHFIVLLVGVFPASLFALMRFKKQNERPAVEQMFHVLMLILFWVVLIIFSIVKTKIVHYSSLCYFPLTFLAALALYDMQSGLLPWRKWLSILLIFFSAFFALLVSALPLVEKYKVQIIQSGLIKDDFALANLQAQVQWTGYEWLLGLVLVLAAMYSAVLAKRKEINKALIVLFTGTTIFIASIILIFPFRIEKYSQGAVIDFYKAKSTEECYILNSGYFSYAPLFYSNKLPQDCARPMWLLSGNIDRPFYLVLKEPHYREWKYLIPAMTVLYKKNGFVFLVRYPSNDFITRKKTN